MREEGAGGGVDAEFHAAALAAFRNGSDEQVEGFVWEPDGGREAASVADADGYEVVRYVG